MTRGPDVDAEFTAFVTSNWPRLVRSAHLLTGDWHRAHDLVQSAMERCYPRWRSIRGDPYS
jgi:DNA-directed RNA polymerase specialized sigma24 family protein